MAKILVADDAAEMREMLKDALSKAKHTVYLADNGIRAVLLAKQHLPDIALIDIRMPGMDGFEVCRYFRRDTALIHIPIICITGKYKLEDKLTGFAAGADDYIVKPFYIDELEARINAVLRRNQALRTAATDTLSQAGALQLDLAHRRVITPDGKHAQLTVTETNLLKYLMAHAGYAISTRTLLQEVWGYPPDAGSTALVRTHIRNLREKLEQNPSTPRYILSQGRQGYLAQG